jgi:hypothetical protein
LLRRKEKKRNQQDGFVAGSEMVRAIYLVLGNGNGLVHMRRKECNAAENGK